MNTPNQFPIYVSTHGGTYYAMILSPNQEVSVSASEKMMPEIKNNSYAHNTCLSFDHYRLGKTEFITKLEFEKKFFAVMDRLTKLLELELEEITK